MKKKYSFWPEEILAVTAGWLAMLKSNHGVNYNFIDSYIEKINIVTQKVNVSFEIDRELLKHPESVWNITYYYDKKVECFFAKRDMLFMVLAHLECAENKVIGALYRGRKFMTNIEILDVQKSVRDMLNKVFQDTVEEYKFKL